MAWQDTVYVQFTDEATARALAMALGVDFPESGVIPTGNQNYAMHAPMQAPWVTPPVFDAEGAEITPGVAEPGYWAMLRFNDDFPGCAGIIEAITAAGVSRELVNPPATWA